MAKILIVEKRIQIFLILSLVSHQGESNKKENYLYRLPRHCIPRNDNEERAGIEVWIPE